MTILDSKSTANTQNKPWCIYMESDSDNWLNSDKIIWIFTPQNEIISDDIKSSNQK